MKIVWSNAAKKEFSRIDSRYQKRIEAKLAELNDRFAPPPDIKKMTFPDDHYRLRVGEYRIIFTVGGETRNDCYVLSVKRRTTTTYLHEEHVNYGCSIHKG